FYPYLSVNSERALTRTLHRNLKEIDPTIGKFELRKAVIAGFRAFEQYRDDLRQAGIDALSYAEKNDHRILILAGRPYHVDPEISHGIDRLAASLGFVVVSEDSICDLTPRIRTRVLNQWTYHARLYRAALFATEHKNVELVQLFSFGCGVDAITSDEVRSILENRGKLYTQIKIDDISNLGAVRIRLRSLIGALEAKDDNSD
ncbi:MAG TPA: acyl-CoA dehydratase activase-related protein, partial [Oscillospiraceae bacterium]|nr:acyl-CoA dehydratase activase-related protein [Oscillospiraceae bacterium]